MPWITAEERRTPGSLLKAGTARAGAAQNRSKARADSRIIIGKAIKYGSRLGFCQWEIIN